MAGSKPTRSTNTSTLLLHSAYTIYKSQRQTPRQHKDYNTIPQSLRIHYTTCLEYIVPTINVSIKEDVNVIIQF